MDIKKLEGTSLNESILTSKPIELSKESENLAIAIKTTVSNALLGALSDEIAKQGYIQATVEEVSKDKVKLLLDNGTEIEVNQELSLNLKPNDILKLVISSLNPLVLKIADVRTPSSPIGLLQKSIGGASQGYTLNSISKEDIANSGLFYEKKLIDVLLKAKDLNVLTSDKKYQLLENIKYLAKEIYQDKNNFVNLPTNIQNAIEDILNNNMSKDTIVNILGNQPNQESQAEQPLQKIFELIANNLQNTNANTSKNILPQALAVKNIVEDINRNYIFFPQKLFDMISNLSHYEKDISTVSDFFKGLTNIISIPDNTAKMLFNKTPSLFFEFLQNPEETINKIQDAAIKDTFLQIAKNVNYIKQNVFSSIVLHAKDIQTLSKPISKEVNTIIENTNFNNKVENLKQSINLLETINLAQEFIIQNRNFFVNFEEKSSKKKGFFAFNNKENTYKAFIKLNWEDGFLGGILEMPKSNHKKLKLSFFTDIEALSNLIESAKDELKNLLQEDGVELEELNTFVNKNEEFDNILLTDINKTDNLNIFI